MLFNSVPFIGFMTIVFIVYWILPHKYRWFMLLLSNYIFYICWDVRGIWIIGFLTITSYATAVMIEKSGNRFWRKVFLVSTVVVDVGILFFFKYFNFLYNNILSFLKIFSVSVQPVTWNFLLPLGISFYTFQTISYVADVYAGKIGAEHHLGRYAVYVSFFPTVGSGPIERAADLLPQIKEKHVFSYEKATYGLKLLTWGVFKKSIIADMLAEYVNKVFENPGNYQGFALAIVGIFFSIQIYCDFSGYSDMAVGIAKLLGFDLTNNFSSPYFSASVKEFWRRWHISLSTWFRDYLYIPLGGNRVGKIRKQINLLVTFLISGLWHGANWTFVVWGGMHGIAQIVENAVLRKQKRDYTRWHKLCRVLIVFTFCTFAWIFFRARNVSDAFYILIHVFDGITEPLVYLRQGFRDIGIGKRNFALYLALILILFVFDWKNQKTDVIKKISQFPAIIRWSVYIGFIELIVLCYSFLAVDAGSFIYFQF